MALIALFSIAADVPEIRDGGCARVLDLATAAAWTADAAAVGQLPEQEATHVRFGAARVLNSLCAVCAACPRGQGCETRVTSAPPAK